MHQRVERLLTEADEAVVRLDWETVRARVSAVLTLDPDNEDAVALMTAAQRGLLSPPERADEVRPSSGVAASNAAETIPASFAAGRYAVKRFLGEGGKKKVYLAHDTTLDRD